MDIYKMITDRIIEKLEAGTVPWHKPWRSIGTPRNLVSKKLYRGVNVWLLTAQGYTSPYWATIRQINELGGQVRKGEKSTPLVFWKIYVDGVEVKTGEPEAESEQPQGQGKRRFVLRYYSSFNTEQCDLPATVIEKLGFLNSGNSIQSRLARRSLPECRTRPRSCTPAIRPFIHQCLTALPCQRADCLKAWKNTGPHSGMRKGTRQRTREG